jgi:hypothetical protein
MRLLSAANRLVVIAVRTHHGTENDT